MIKIVEPHDSYRNLLMAFRLLDYLKANERHRLHNRIGGCAQGD